MSGYPPNRTRYATRQKRQSNWGFIGTVTALCLFVLLGVAMIVTAYFNSTHDVTARVNKTGQTCTKSCTNLVYTDHGTFQNSDSLLAGKFNSSDVTGALCPGGVYKLKVRGWRVPILSWWPNVLKVEEVVSAPPSGSGCTNG